MGGSSWANLNQLTDTVFTATYKFLFLDKNFVDGTFKILGDPGYQVGWGSTELSNSSGVFTTPIILEVPIPLQNIEKIIIIGNDKLNHYPTKYDIEIFNDSTSMLKLTNITQNSIQNVIPINPMVYANKIVYTFYSNNVAGTTLKLIQAFPYFLKSSSESPLISLEEKGIVLALQERKQSVQLVLIETQRVSANIPVLDLGKLSFEETVKISNLVQPKDSLDITMKESYTFTHPTQDKINLNFEEKNNFESIHTVLKSPTRTVLAKVRIKYTSDDIPELSTVSSNVPPAYNSNLDNLINGVKVSLYKYLYANEGIADGSYHPVSLGSDAPVSFPIQSDSSGVLATPLELTVNFGSATTVKTLYISGDNWLENYPVDFEIKVYSSASTLIDTVTITNNSSVSFIKTVSYSNVEKVVYTITKISRPLMYPKIQELTSGVVEEYYNDNIISINILEEAIPISSEIDLGQVSANQLELSLINTEGYFSSTNNNSPIANLINLNREIRVFFGAQVGEVIEWYQMGVFYSNTVKTSFKDVTASFLAYDTLSLVNTEICTIPTLVNTTVYDLIFSIFENSSLTGAQYVIDPTLLNYELQFGFVPFGSIVDALSFVAQSCMIYIFCDRQGRVVVAQRQTPQLPQTTYLPGDIYDYTNILDQRAVVNDVSITYQSYIETPLGISAISNDIFEIIPGETRDLYLAFENKFISEMKDITYSKGNDIQVLLTQVTSWGLYLQVKNTGSTVQTIGDIAGVVTELIPNEENQFTIELTNNDSISTIGRYTYDYSHQLIQTATYGKQLANDILAYFSTVRPIMELDCRGDFAIDLGHDVVAQTYNDFSSYSYYKQIRCQHEWTGAYSAMPTLEYVSDINGVNQTLNIQS